MSAQLITPTQRERNANREQANINAYEGAKLAGEAVQSLRLGYSATAFAMLIAARERLTAAINHLES